MVLPERKKSKRYGNSAEEDELAEKTIVKEHAERSHTTAGFNETGRGAGGEGNDNDDGDADFDGFMAADDGADLYSGDNLSNDIFDTQVRCRVKLCSFP